MRLRNLNLHQIADQRLIGLGCSNLPSPVRQRIIADFVADVEKKLNRLARRQITVPKIAKIFTASMLPQEGVLEGGLQALPSNEMRPANVAYGDTSQAS